MKLTIEERTLLQNNAAEPADPKALEELAKKIRSAFNKRLQDFLRAEKTDEKNSNNVTQLKKLLTTKDPLELLSQIYQFYDQKLRPFHIESALGTYLRTAFVTLLDISTTSDGIFEQLDPKQKTSLKIKAIASEESFDQTQMKVALGWLRRLSTEEGKHASDLTLQEMKQEHPNKVTELKTLSKPSMR